MKQIKSFIFFLLIICCTLSPYWNVYAEERLKLSTTTSTENSGLLGTLLPPFEKMCNVRIDVIPVGTGKALKLAENGDVDVTLVHARTLEDKFVAEGYGVNRRDVMYNDFVIIGPSSDPAGIKKAKSAVEAFSYIAKKKALFISRGDRSGTNIKELKIWENAGIKPRGAWYLESGKGMGEVLTMAYEKTAYTITDRGTYLAYVGEKKIDSRVLFEGDSVLFNPYGIIAVNPATHPHVNYVKALALIGWVTSQEGQKIIREFGKEKFGQPLFIPVAIPTSPQ
ncbi:MAG: substrate-binding domain-containing protein [Thermodesulfobacteriota bacterium]|nr:substrate-binding domain-containing protein [Thermodesulfobacteriota bacterium]